MYSFSPENFPNSSPSFIKENSEIDLKITENLALFSNYIWCIIYIYILTKTTSVIYIKNVCIGWKLIVQSALSQLEMRDLNCKHTPIIGDLLSLLFLIILELKTFWLSNITKLWFFWFYIFLIQKLGSVLISLILIT